MSRGEQVASYVDTWAAAVEDVVALLRSLSDDDWSRPTDLPGWDVRAVAPHLAHLESELAGNAQEDVEVQDAEHVVSPMGAYTEQGADRPVVVVDRRDHRRAGAFVREAAGRTRADPPTDPKGAPPITPGGIGWPWETLLSNRPLDVWMHKQDIRRAVGRPGGLDSAGAAHTTAVFARGLGYVVGKRVAPPAGTSVVLDVTGPHLVHVAVSVGDDGRASRIEHEPVDPTLRITTDIESYIVLCGGRRGIDYVNVSVMGDPGLGRRVLESMAVTP